MTDVSLAMTTAQPAPAPQDPPQRRHPLREIFATNSGPILATQGLTVSDAEATSWGWMQVLMTIAEKMPPAARGA